MASPWTYNLRHSDTILRGTPYDMTAVKLGIGGSLRTVKVSPGDRWVWLMIDSQGSRPDIQCGQGVKHEKLMGQDLDPGRGWKYRCLCSVPPFPLSIQNGLETGLLWHQASAYPSTVVFIDKRLLKP